MDGQELEALPAPWGPIARRIGQADGGGRAVAFDAALEGLGEETAQRVRRAVFAADPNGLAPGAPMVVPYNAPSDVPELPAVARLTAAHERAAGEADAWLAAYVDYSAAVSPRSPRAFHEVIGLWIAGLAIARRLHLPLGHGGIFPNLYALLLAPTTLFAKSTALRVGYRLVDLVLPHLLLSADFTPESILDELAGIEPAGLQGQAAGIRELWQRGRNFAAQRGILLDEASGLFAGLRRDYMVGTAELLLKLYDCTPTFRRHTKGAGFVVVRNAALSFLGATTPVSLRQAQVAAAWVTGLWARFALVTPDGPPVYALPEMGDVAPPPSLTGPLAHLAGELLPTSKFPDPPESQAVAISDEAFGAYRHYDRAVAFDLLTGDAQPDERLWGTYGRLPTHALKVALALAALDWASGDRDAPRIEIGHWARGQQVVEGWRASAHRCLHLLVDGADELGEEERVLRILRRAGERGHTAREVGQLTKTKRILIEPALELLARDGIVERFRPEGARADRYRIREV
ncbi:MAG TPA: DUF3987 domain-containing protein [Anaerolineae bacterium]|nr:DUF3987 domain-containing protein [Anaerolineae bacterium]